MTASHAEKIVKSVRMALVNAENALKVIFLSLPPTQRIAS
jgi:hypothetical protein